MHRAQPRLALLPRVAVGASVVLATAMTAGAVAASGHPTGSTTPPGGGADAPLRILVTNDDGWEAAGITAVHEALMEAGHDVVVVAPADNQSGTGARVTFGGELTLTQERDGVYSVSGTPADSAELGMAVAFGGELPDLVVSGANEGQNIASAEVHSGTVGAAVTALNEGVPAIAVSTEIDFATGEGDFAGTAAFVVDLVGALSEAAEGGPLLPAGIGLNVNFPLVDDGGAPAGVVIAPTDASFVDVDYPEALAALPPVGESVAVPVAVGLDPPVDPSGDAAQLAADQITITFITGNYDAVDADVDLAALDELATLVTSL
jgi:5'/3'-nucleotidase SurE